MDIAVVSRAGDGINSGGGDFVFAVLKLKRILSGVGEIVLSGFLLLV